MRLLLDTCAILWVVSDPDQLSTSTQKMLVADDTEILVSPMSCAEICCLVAKKRIQLDRHWKLWFRHHTEKNGWNSVPVDLPIIEEAYSLQGDFHSDPVDRIIVATARFFDAMIITADQKMIAYPHVRSER